MKPKKEKNNIFINLALNKLTTEAESFAENLYFIKRFIDCPDLFDRDEIKIPAEFSPKEVEKKAQDLIKKTIQMFAGEEIDCIILNVDDTIDTLFIQKIAQFANNETVQRFLVVTAVYEEKEVAENSILLKFVRFREIR